jgi:hypothetical protein
LKRCRPCLGGERLIAKLEIDELKSLDMVEQDIREDERAKENQRFTSDRPGMDNIIILVIVVAFLCC